MSGLIRSATHQNSEMLKHLSNQLLLVCFDIDGLIAVAYA